ncbi:nucleotide exchange factor GrpE [Candidatus Daviesbacteria bacterium]|nr:nucleotide exchange factor GrpE [Candidatus Daviesbacteria bacterium]
MGKKNADLEKLQQELESVKELSQQLENQLKRAVADYHNLEKRVQEGRSELTRWGTGELLVKILPVLDHLETVIRSGRQVLSERSESKEWFRGVELAVKELNQVLQSEGLEEVKAEGEFNPALQEAVDTRQGEDNKILEVVRSGYTLNGKILRPAQVVVGKSEIRDKSQESRQEQEKQEENTSL